MPELPLGNAVDKTDLLSLAEKIAMFPGGIPLIFPSGSKGEKLKDENIFNESPWNKYRFGWGKRTLKDTEERQYQADLYDPRPKNVGIRAIGLVRWFDFDFDSPQPDVYADFFAANPRLKENSIFIIGGRGGGFKIPLLFSDFAGQKKEVISFTGVKGKIEWLTTHGVIDGLHPKTREPYRFFVVGKGLESMRWGELTCPGTATEAKYFWNPWPRLFNPEEERKKLLHSGIKLSEEASDKRLAAIALNWTLLGLKDNNTIAQVRCPNADNHSNDTGEGETIIYTGIDGSTPNFYCLHSHCEQKLSPEGNPDENGRSVNQHESERLRELLREKERIMLYPDTIKFARETTKLFGLLHEKHKFYRRNERPPFALWYWEGGSAEPVEITSSKFNELMGKNEIGFNRPRFFGKKLCIVEDKPKKDEILEFSSSDDAVNLPVASKTIRTPLLVKTLKGARILTQVYCTEHKSFVLGTPEQAERLSKVSFDSARKNLEEFSRIWKWQEESDRARGISELLTPALLHGGFIKRPIPAFLTTADELNAGKTFWHQSVGTIYQEEIDSHVIGNGHGGLREQLMRSIMVGEPFFLVDELDGQIKDAFLNALLTGASRKNVRVAYTAFAQAAVDNFIVMLAGVKGFTVEEQLASRLIPLRLLKVQSSGAKGQYQWIRPDGTLVSQWVRENAWTLLGSVYALLIEWERRGYPLLAPDSRFPEWNQAIDWILTNLLELPPSNSGLTNIQKELASNAGGWGNSIFAAVSDTDFVIGQNGGEFHFDMSQLRDIFINYKIEIPGTRNGLTAQEAVRDQKSSIFNALCRLPHEVLDEAGNMAFYVGDRFIYKFRDGNRNGKPKYVYALSLKSTKFSSTKKYDKEITRDED